MRTPIRLAHAGLWGVRLAILGGALLLAYLTATIPDEELTRRTAPAAGIEARPSTLVLDREPIEDGGFSVAALFTAPIHDPRSLGELREAVRVRGRLGLAVLQAEFDRVRLSFRPSRDEVIAVGQLLDQIGLLNLYEGRYSEAGACFQKALEVGRPKDAPEPDRARRRALLGIIAMRQARADNDLKNPGQPGGIFPTPPEAAYSDPSGSREAIKRFTAYLEEWPDDLGIRWLLNLAYMTLGEYPEKVPAPYLVPLDSFRSKLDVGRFENVAAKVGLGARGANLAGGCAFDDFDGDGRPDLFTTSPGIDRGASLFINRGDGTFADRSADAGLADQVYALNLARADYDNDGDLDVVILRGGGERPMRPSLLRNRGDGRFEDVTIACGMAEPIASGSAAWGDYDNDGLIDLFVCGEYQASSGGPSGDAPDRRNLCRLYRNQGDGTFIDVAAAAGVTNERCAIGSAWGDYDDDGYPDLYVSNRGGPGRLYHNLGYGKFVDVAPSRDVAGNDAGPACGFWDFDNDGRQDLYVGESRAAPGDIVATILGRRVETAGRPRLYRNLGAEGFRDVAPEVGLDRPMAGLACGFGDIDDDGYLDLYLGTGWRSYSGLVPNRMFKNVAGLRFEEVTISSGTGSLQIGNGVSFADFDEDGDLDIFVQSGGIVPGDPSPDLLFRNPGHGRHGLKVKLVGTRTNRAAIGARLRVDLKSSDGKSRSIYRAVGGDSGRGDSSLVESIGLEDAASIDAITVSWPTSRTTQSFRDIAADRAIEITEGMATYRVFRRRPPTSSAN